MKNDEQVVRLAVENNAFALAFASDELKNNREIVWNAVKRDIRQRYQVPPVN